MNSLWYNGFTPKIYTFPKTEKGNQDLMDIIIPKCCPRCNSKKLYKYGKIYLVIRRPLHCYALRCQNLTAVFLFVNQGIKSNNPNRFCEKKKFGLSCFVITWQKNKRVKSFKKHVFSCFPLINQFNLQIRPELIQYPISMFCSFHQYQNHDSPKVHIHQ